MKSKKTVYVLLPIVIALWGMIGWKVYAAMHGSADGNANNTTIVSPPIVEQNIPDTFELSANYRDPFLEDAPVPQKNPVSHAPTKPKPVSQPVVTPALTWPKLSYFGLVRRSADQKTVGFLSVDGKNHFVKVGDVIGVVTITSVWKDSVAVTMGKEKKVVRK